MAAGQVRSGRMAVLFAVMLVAAAGNTAMQSVLPAIGTKLGIADVWVTLAFSWSALLWVMTAPHWARQSDKRGRKALMQLGLGGFVASMASCGLILWAGLNGWIGVAATFIAFALFRSLYGGFGSATPPAVQAYVASRTDKEHRTQAMSVIASSFGLGTVIGPALAPFFILPVFGLAGPMLVFAVIGVLVAIALRLALPNDAPSHAARGNVTAEPLSGGNSGGSLTSAEDESAEEGTETRDPPRLRFSDPRVRPWFLAGLIGGHANAMILGVMGFVILDRLHLRATPELATDPTGIVLMAGAGATLLAQWGLIPMLHLQPRASVLIGMGIAIIGALLTAQSHELHGLTLGFAIASMGFGLFRPGFTAGSSLAVARIEQGGVAGMVASINGAAYIFAPAIGVLLYQWHSWAAFGVIMALCALVLFWGWRELDSTEPR